MHPPQSEGYLEVLIRIEHKGIIDVYNSTIQPPHHHTFSGKDCTHDRPRIRLTGFGAIDLKICVCQRKSSCVADSLRKHGVQASGAVRLPSYWGGQWGTTYRLQLQGSGDCVKCIKVAADHVYPFEDMVHPTPNSSKEVPLRCSQRALRGWSTAKVSRFRLPGPMRWQSASERSSIKEGRYIRSITSTN